MNKRQADNSVPSFGDLLGEEPLICPGLTPGAFEIDTLAQDLPGRIRTFMYKDQSPSIWVVFLGGTGTGKSTLFNALCGKMLSITGIERPKTRGSLAYAHQDSWMEEGFPFPDMLQARPAREGIPLKPTRGIPGKLQVFTHDHEDLRHTVLVDTPDVDSLEPENRKITQNIYLLADIVVFVTSQEKYADEIPFRFLRQTFLDQKPCFVLANKARRPFGPREVKEFLRDQDLAIEENRIGVIPFAGKEVQGQILKDPGFLGFKEHLLKELSPENQSRIRATLRRNRAKDLRIRTGRVIEILEEEREAAGRWLDGVDSLLAEVSRELLEEEKERFSQRSREYLKREIKRLFARYDILAGPRRFVRNLLQVPLHILGFYTPPRGKSREEELSEIREKMNLEPVLRSLDTFNVRVLESIPFPERNSPLWEMARRPEIGLDREAVERHLFKKQEELYGWLEETFRKLSREIPKGKKWGIYSTSILWGILILSLETAVGGGFTLLDATLDSVLAPFVTKGAIELFAYQEIQRVAGELSRRYREGLLSVLRLQKQRYEDCLFSLSTPPETLERLKTLHSRLGANQT
ncbi:MAG: GTPase domain-containing protein [Deltaproteobacteria bacterium]|nr:GTPase domain-containing protein [Deltaproteobacteria bacterium]